MHLARRDVGLDLLDVGLRVVQTAHQQLARQTSPEEVEIAVGEQVLAGSGRELGSVRDPARLHSQVECDEVDDHGVLAAVHQELGDGEALVEVGARHLQLTASPQANLEFLEILLGEHGHHAVLLELLHARLDAVDQRTLHDFVVLVLGSLDFSPQLYRITPRAKANPSEAPRLRRWS